MTTEEPKETEVHLNLTKEELKEWMDDLANPFWGGHRDTVIKMAIRSHDEKKR